MVKYDPWQTQMKLNKIAVRQNIFIFKNESSLYKRTQHETSCTI